ncbi:hypothetical protein BD410DRAFT_737550 [Rickenella mellea]|uniref:RFX-type winged-helix domain-containing protein n=1 Tax=Rickenella mellea TaxID=50990 RepID=A0A4Y7QMQ0_9AGAM|nr:hypothetical protein BD410DRAFT_737550 [Rickenella mellea]
MAATGYVRGGVPTAYYRNAGYLPHQVPQHRPAPTVTDDYERWYTEAISSNRMLLALRSCLLSEIGWALDRLCRLCNNEQFVLRAIPGLTDALFEWPEWYLRECSDEKDSQRVPLFALSSDHEKKMRHALESLFILRNAALNEPNAVELAGNPRTRPLIFGALQRLKPDTDANVEFILHCVEILHAIASTLVLPPLKSGKVSPLQPLEEWANTSSNRTVIISCLTALGLILANPLNASHLSSTSPAITASIRLLPLFIDKPLVDACLNYLYAHLSHLPMTKAFLLHPDMPATLKLLVSFLISEQVEEIVSIDIAGPVFTAYPFKVNTVNYELSPEELEDLASKAEPERCYEWMKVMFIPKTDGELTQVDFWNFYKDTFTPYQERHPLLVASDVIKNVNTVFPTAQAMVLPGPPQRFVVRGVDRRKRDVEAERFVCQWNRSGCATDAFKGAGDLYSHLEGHLEASEVEGDRSSCLWATCSHLASSPENLRRHVLTHIPPKSILAKDPAQPKLVTLATSAEPELLSRPTERTPAPAPNASLRFPAPIGDPPSSSLTALLIIRTLFRASFASSDIAPRADADHFGFPGVEEEQEEQEEQEMLTSMGESDREGERKGKKAFVGVRRLMETVRIHDSVLMGWITEMVDAGMTGVR